MLCKLEYLEIQQWNKLNILVVDTKNVAVKIKYLLIWVVSMYNVIFTQIKICVQLVHISLSLFFSYLMF